MPDGRRVPFTLLGGYLGAGKTTILNHLIRHADGRRLVVLVNDIGAVNVDASLVARHDGTTLTLTNGCVCCSIADEVGPTLEQIRALDPPPDHVVMELSGVAEPARVAPWASTPGFRLDGVVVAVDAEQIRLQAERPDIGDTVRAQLGAADLVVLTKTDLVADDGASARSQVAGLTAAPVVTAVDGHVEPGVILGVDRTAPPETVGAAASPEQPVGHRVGSIRFDGTRAELERLLDQLSPSVLRAKGLLRCRDTDVPIEVNVVGRRRRLQPRPDLSGGGDVIVVIEL